MSVAHYAYRNVKVIRIFEKCVCMWAFISFSINQNNAVASQSD